MPGGAVALEFPGYRVVRELGHGGQGRVLQAIRLADNRKVALKIIHSDRLADARARARFEQEHETLARLAHPGVVHVFEHGELASGEVWFAAEYIAGEPLDRYVDQLDQTARVRHTGRSEAPFPLDSTLRLLCRVCEAVQAAHRAGVIHRDLKPSNILVDGVGRPHILDFGLARPPVASDPNVVTLTGEYLGSPAWSSPEQIEGQPAHVDTRTDVYSLGVILYRVLTGAFPYDVEGPLIKVFDQIRQAEPIPPRSLVTFINDELQAILLKALAKERERRYQSVAELQADIERYLAGAPVHAKGEGRAYAIRKFVRRHRVLTGAVAAVVGLSLIHAAAMTVLYRRAVLAETQAERNATHARAAVELILTELDEKLRDVVGMQDLRLELLESAYRTVNALREQYGDDQRLNADHARALTKLSDIAMTLGRFDEALRDRETALGIYRDLAALEPDKPDWQARLSIAHVLVGDTLKASGDVQAGMREYQTALRIDERLARAYPEEDDYLDNLAWSYERMGWLARQRNDEAVARAYYEKRHELAVALAERHPDSQDRQYGLYASLSLLAELHRRCQNHELERPLRQEAREVIERLVEQSPDNPRFIGRLASCYGVESTDLALHDRVPEGIELRRRQIELLRRLARAEPAVCEHRRSLAVALICLAKYCDPAGDVDGRDASLAEAVSLLESVTAERVEDWRAWEWLMEGWCYRGICAADAGDETGARVASRRALDISRRLIERAGSDDGQLEACARVLLTVQPSDLRDPPAALQAARRAVEWSAGRDPQRLEILALAHAACGQPEAATAALERAIVLTGEPVHRARYERKLAELRAGKELSADTSEQP